MSDEAARSREPATTEGDGSAQPSAPDSAPSTPTGAGAPAAAPSDPAAGAAADPGASNPPPGAGAPPPWGYDVPGAPPPGDGSAGFTFRYGLVRPQEGRYVAGVCAAIGRATNTDPVLWRVLLVVLGFFGGIGILVYLAAWLVIPAEGDSASPVESMLGRGRSSMSPVTVIILSVLVAVMFGLIVTDRFRAVLLGAAILIGGALLLNRNTGSGRVGLGAAGTEAAAPPPGPVPPGAPPPGPVPPGAPPTQPADANSPTGPLGPYAPGRPTPYPLQPAGAPLPAPPYPAAPSPYITASSSAPPFAGPGTAPTAPVPPGYSAPPAPATAPFNVPPPPGGYRPPFAPRGPYAGSGPLPPNYPARKPPHAPKPPRERSPLGAATFSMIFVALGVVAILDLVNVIRAAPSTYFAAALVTIALGLLVGAWFGRARWLIALGLAATAALGISTLAESYDRPRPRGPVNWQPTSPELLADRYENTFGDAVLDLTRVDFAGQDRDVSVQVNFGQLDVLVPPNVDVTARVDVNAGDARVFGTRWSGVGGNIREVRDVGPDGPGGGKLRLIVHVNAGDVEVHR